MRYPRTYDATLRLKSVSMPSQGTTGGWQSAQTYLYDGRGNKTKVYVDSFGNNYDLQYSTAAHRPDLLIKEGSGGLAHDFYNDNDGFAYAISTPNKSPTELGSYFYFSKRAAGTYSHVWFTDLVTSKAYVYNYDVFNRRVRKGWPTDTSDWFFYDTGHQMLEDLGVSSTVYPGSPYPIDEYIWLDGRPVAVVRSKLDASLARSADGTGTCARNGQSAACDTYFIVTDHIGKPVLSLNSSRRITGVGEYEPFGALNRSEAWWGTNWTYGPGAGDSPLVVQQRSHGMTTAFRAHFTRFDVEEAGCGGGFLDGIQTFDDTTSAACGQYTGHLGESWTAWCPTAQNGSGYSRYKLNWHTDATNCAPGCWIPPCDPGTYAGFTMRDYEYQRYQADAGASMYFPPLRFPGQYYDEETHLHENWNRTYGPVIGRYLQQEPLFESPSTIVFQTLLEPRQLNAYAYAANNPINRYDDNGLMDSQAKRDGQPNQVVRDLEGPLRKELSERCAKEQTQNLNDCRKKANQAAAAVKCDPKGGKAAQKQADEERVDIMKSFNCDKGAKCEYEACMAGANSGVGTVDYMIARQRCISQ